MEDKVKLAAVQFDVKLGRNKDNLGKMLELIRAASANGAKLIVLPECALSGYVFSSREEALPHLETIPGPSTKKIATNCADLKVHVVFGLLEKEGGYCFNSAALVGPQGLIGRYRKTHLPFLGIDRFLDCGNDPFRVYDTAAGKIGMLICYDCTFPEGARVLALEGADILALPTNWPQGRAKIPQYVLATRAFENKYHIVAADRIGIERDVQFIGTSKIVHCSGNTLAEASVDKEEIIYAEILLSEAREKRSVIKPGEFETNFMRDRKPHLYRKIAEELGR
jgi:predicted amidohydrolase